jgi:transglutaminase-like putative cysteine protease
VAFGDRHRWSPVAHPALAVVPALVLVTWSAAVEPGLTSSVLCLALIGFGGVALLVGDQPVPSPGGESAAATRAAPRRGVQIALLPPLAVFLAVVLSVAGSGALGTGRGQAFDSSGAPTAEALVSNVVGFAAQDPNVVLFRARTEVPTYWQVAVLTRQVDGTWEVAPRLGRAIAARGSSEAGAQGSGPAAGLPSHVAAHVTIASYQGRVLPVPLGASAVRGPYPTQLVDDAVVQERPTSSGEQYVVTGSVSAPSQRTLSSPNESESATSGDLEPAPSGTIPPQVQALARQVVAGSNEQGQMVQRLVNWFRSGRFRYSTAAQPVSPRGTSAVLTFLTKTKVGNCQTFTDAFAVMAQSLAIPVRVAVGFNSGAWEPSGDTTVTGADAHTWPEVSVSPASGWVSVEPTPASSVTAILPVGVLGVGPVSPKTPTTVPPRTPTSASPTSPTTTPVPTSAAPTVPSTQSAGPAAGKSRQTVMPWIILGFVALAGVLIGLIVLGVRRRRRGGLEPPESVVEAWRESDRSLARRGLGCPPSRTHLDHARTLREEFVGSGRIDRKPSEPDRLGFEQLVRDVEALALLEREVRYGTRPVGEPAASEAWAAAQRVRRSLRYRHLGRKARRLVPTSGTPGQRGRGTKQGVYASSGHGGNHGEGLGGADRPAE